LKKRTRADNGRNNLKFSGSKRLSFHKKNASAIRSSKATKFVLLLACLLQPTVLPAESVVVRHPEGVSHGFLVLRTLNGKPIADGESTQVAQGDRVTNRMWFRFTDGSIYDETTVFSQRGTFKLLSDHVLQKGPAFRRPLETTIDANSGQVTVRYTDDAKEKVLTERLELPPDVANGILFALLKNVQRSAPRTTVSYVVAKTAACQSGGHSARPGALLDWQAHSQSHALRRESENRRCSGRDSISLGKTAAEQPSFMTRNVTPSR